MDSSSVIVCWRMHMVDVSHPPPKVGLLLAASRRRYAEASLQTHAMKAESSKVVFTQNNR